MSLAYRTGAQPFEIVRNDGPMRIATGGPGLRGLPGAPGAGDVIGPSSATDGHAAVFDGADGKHLRDGGKALPGGAIVGTTDAQTLSNKTLASPALTGTPTAPSAALGTDTDQVATTAFVQDAMAASELISRVVEIGVYESAGIYPGLYPDTVADRDTLLSAGRVDLRDGSGDAAADIWLLVNGTAAAGPWRVALGSPADLTGVSVTLAAGDVASLCVSYTAGTPYDLTAKFWGA